MPKFTFKAFVYYWLPVIIWLGVIFAESMSPFAAVDQTSRIIVPLLHWLMPRLDPTQLVELHHLLRKVGHFVGYGLLSYFFFRAWHGTHHVHAGTSLATRKGNFSETWRIQWALLALICTATVASMDEMHQMTLSNRGGSWLDVLLDTTGALIFQIAILLVARYRERTKQPGRISVGA